MKKTKYKEGLPDGLRNALSGTPQLYTAREIEEMEAKQRWAQKPVCVITNTSFRPIIWDINGRGTCSVRFMPGCSVTASAMQMEGMTKPPPGIVVERYNPDNRQHIRFKRIG